MRESNHPQPGSSRPAADDLQKIAGIGATLATRLAGAGVIRYRDLASVPPARLAVLARVSPQKIASQDWIGQARRLADDVPGAAETSEPEGQQSYATFHVELLVNADNTVRRTKTRHYQTDTEDSWPGWDDQHLIAVIRRKAGLGDPGRRPARPRPTPPSPIHVEGPGPAEEGTRGTFRLVGQPTAVRMSLQVSPLDGVDAGAVDFIADVAALSVGTGDRHPLGVASGAVTIGQPVSLELAGPPLPPGMHRLEAAVAIYGHHHQHDDRPLGRHRSLGGLVHIADHHAQQQLS